MNAEDFSSGREKQLITFCTNRLEVLQGMSVYFFAQNNEDLTRLRIICMFNNKQSLANILDGTPKPSHSKGITYRTHFYAQNRKCPRSF